VARPRWAAASGLALLVLLSGGCDSQSHSAPSAGHTSGGTTPGSPAPVLSSSTAVAKATLRCEMPIGQRRHPERGTVVRAGAIALPSAVPYRSRASGFPHRLYVKVGLDVRAGHTAVLSVPPHWSHRVALTWATNAQSTPWTTQLDIPACPRSGSDVWLVYPGGFTLDRQACVPLRIAVGEETTTFHEAIGGARC
jgi:hypothetical protein